MNNENHLELNYGLALPGLERLQGWRWPDSEVCTLYQYKQMESALRELETRYRQLVEFCPEAIAVYSEGKFIYINPAGTKLLGAKTPQEIIGKPIVDILHPDDRKTIPDRTLPSFENRKNTEILEQRFLRLDGEIVNVEVTGIPTVYEGKPAIQVVIRDISDRKRAEAELRESRERYRAVFTESSDGIYLVDVDSKHILEVNPAICQLLGYTAEEMLGLTLYDIVPLDKETIDRSAEQILAEKHLLITEVYNRHKNGSLVNVEVNLSLISYSGKQVVCAVIRDVTERKKAQDALRESEARLQAILDYCPSAIFLKDLEGRYIKSNRRTEISIGLTKEEIIGKTDYDFFTTELADIFRDTDRQLLTSGVPITLEQAVPENGDLHAFMTTKFLIYDSAGVPSAICGIAAEITERVRAEEALRQSEEKYRRIIETTSDGIWSIDPQGNTVFVNSKMAEMLGCTIDEMLGKSAFEFIDEEWQAEAKNRIERCCQGIQESKDFKFRRKNGSELWALLSTNSICDRDGKVVHCLGMLADITARKQAEEALQKSEATNRALLNAIPDLMIRMAKDGTYLDFRPAKNFPVIMPSHDMRGKNLFEIMPPEFAKQRMYYVEQAIATEEPQIYEYEMSIDGKVSYEEARIVVSGKDEVLVIVRDISDRQAALRERKKAEEKLERSLSLLRGTLEATADGIIVNYNDGGIATFNQKFLEMWGMPESRVESGETRQVLEFLLTQVKEPESFLARVKELFSQPQVVGYDTIELKDGRIFERYSLPQQLVAGKSARVCSFRDITDRKRAEEELRKSQERFQLLAGATNDAVWDLDLLTNQVWWNECFEVLFGYKSDEVVPDWNFWYENVHPEDRERVTARFKAQIENNEQLCAQEYRFRRANGCYAFVLDRCYIIHNEMGEAVRAIGAMMDISERKKAEEIIRYQASYDLLTALPNRVLFNERLLLSLKDKRDETEMVAVMFLDLDRFKTINDTLGHAAGDRVLETVARRISNCLRQSDTVARWGGDEFTVVLPEIYSQEDAAKIAQRILEALQPTINIQGHKLHVTSSIGIALYPSDGTEIETLLRNADAALYLAKEQGRNNYQFYSPALNSEASELLILENELYHALKRGEFVVYYQPQVNAATGEVIGMEALMRWQHPKLGLVSPAKFIPLAEETGLIAPIGEWVLQTACRQCKAWQDAGLPPLTVAVNLSARQFQQPKLAETIENILSQVGLSPQFLELEITESIAMQNAEKTRSILEDLHKMGVRLSMDDFGTGYSSLSYLKNFPLDTLKIDRSFVSELTNNPRDAGIINAVMMLGKGLKLKVIAEGVETEAQKNCLQSLDCEEMQGYLFSKPLSPENATNFLHNYLANIEGNCLVA